MPRPLGWTDVRALAEALEAAHPDVDLDRLRFTDLHRWIAELPCFSGDPEASNETLLEAIYLAWRDERE
jgi:FeS assembly protein IscX